MRASPGGSAGKESDCGAGDAGDGFDPWVRKNPGSGRSPEEEMATHSSILAWEIPWTEEPDGLQRVTSNQTRLETIVLSSNKGSLHCLRIFCPI